MSRPQQELAKGLNMQVSSLSDAKAKLAALEQLQAKYAGTTQLSVAEQAKLTNAIKKTKREIENLQKTQPKSLNDVLGMDDKSFDAIAKKMAALKKVSWANDEEQKKVIDAYQKLRLEQNKLLSNNAKLSRSNNYLAQSFGYIRNRIVYALTLGAITNFTKQIYEIRAEYELLERSLGILIDNMRRGSEIFNELNAMALKSPFTLTELATGAKQLMAYNFAEDEVVETTRRLADISSALGVPMERLVYNLGQIRAQTVLNARDARDFANAGLAIVPMLAELYNKEKRFGDELVTTSKVYSMMTQKMVSYADVMKVINSITDEGGKFFDFQAKQAETMKVQMNNLTLSWNNMLNAIGEQHQDVLTAPLRGLKYLFENWEKVVKVLKEVILVFGVYKSAALMVALMNKGLYVWQTITAFLQLAKSVKTAKDAMLLFNMVCKLNPFGLLISAIVGVVGYFSIFNDSVDTATAYTRRFGENGGKTVRDVESLYAALESLDKESSTYKKVLGELNQILADFNLTQIEEKDGIDEVIKSREKNIQLIKEEVLERQHLNDVQQGKDEYEDALEKERKNLRAQLSDAITENFLGFGTINKEIVKNAPALANIISGIVEHNIDLIANKTGEEYEEGVQRIFDIIQDRIRNNKSLGLSDDVLNTKWLENNWFRHFQGSNIIQNYIEKVKAAKDAQEAYNEAIEENYKAEMEAAQSGADFNDRVDMTSASLEKAATDTEKFYKRIQQLIKDYSGQNIIDFLVRVKTDVPKWMLDMDIKQLAHLASRFAAIATQVQKSGAEGMELNGKWFSTQEIYARAAQYAEAYRQRAEYEESRQTAKMTQAASNALKEYKTALEAVSIAKNKLKQGTADQALVTEKEADAERKYQEALKAGVSLEELEKAKNGKGKKKDELAEALKEEIRLINEMRSNYDKLRKEGVSNIEAIDIVTKNYEGTLTQVNATLQKYGINKFNASNFAGKNVHDLLDTLTRQRDQLLASGKAKTTSMGALEIEIQKLIVDAKAYDMKKITDGLNNELSKLKEDYELAVELEANPELGNVFAEILGIDLEELPQNIDDYAKRVMDKLNEALKARGENFTLDRIDYSDTEINALKEFGLSDQSMQEIKKASQEIRALKKKEAEEIYKSTKDLQYKLADTNGKIAIEEEKLAKLQEKLAKETNQKKRELLQLQIQDQKNAIQKLKEDVLQMLPTYVNLFNSIAEHSTAITRKLAKQWKEALMHAVQVGTDEYQVTDPISGATATVTKSQLGKQLDKVNEKLRETQPPLKKIKESFTKGEDGIIDWVKGIEQIGDELKKMSELANVVADIAEAFGNPNEYNETAEAIRDIANSLAGVSQMTEGFGKLAAGDYIGGATSILSGAFSAISTWFDNGDKKIDQQIKDSQQNVEKLQLAYIDLQRSIDKAYGAGINEANQAAAAAKKLELYELERQLRLEKSRDSKHKDEERIRELEHQIKELKNEIADLYRQVVDTLLGSDVGSFAENLVSSMIDAFKQGEDYMETFSKKFDEMIDNMIVKSITSRIVASYLDKIWEDFENRLKERSKNEADAYAKAQAENEEVQNMSDKEIRRQLAEQNWGNWTYYYRISQEEVDAYREMYEAAEKAAKAALDAATEIDDSDIDYILGETSKISEELSQKLADAIGKYYTFGQDSEKNLSALQQGIQGITEETAGALEAYMNNVSQQMYVHTELLTQIRDAIVTLDGDVQLATQAQMLLQLQQSYQVQMTIQNILQGVLNPSARAFQVELLS